jgi:hypothetical protein
MPLMRHASIVRNLPSIFARGLLKSKSRGRRKVVWLHSPGLTSWTVLHVAHRHNVPLEQVVVLEVSVPRSALRRNRRGLRYCVEDIAPERIRRVITLGEVASPVAASSSEE